MESPTKVDIKSMMRLGNVSQRIQELYCVLRPVSGGSERFGYSPSSPAPGHQLTATPGVAAALESLGPAAALEKVMSRTDQLTESWRQISTLPAELRTPLVTDITWRFRAPVDKY